MKKIVLFVFSLLLIGCSDHDDAPPPITLTKIDLIIDRDVIPVGVTTQAQVIGYYTDGTTDRLNVTQLDTLESSSNIDTSDRDSYTFFITANAAGEAKLTVSEAGFTDTETFIVSDAELTSIAVTPGYINLIEGLTQTYSATGTYSDDSTHLLEPDVVLWASSDTAVSTIDNATAIATAVSAGNTTISATVGIINGETNLRTVYKTLSSIEIMPATEQLSLPVGVTKTFYARAFYDNGTDEDVTENENFSWKTSDSLILTNNHTNDDGFNQPYNIYTAKEVGVADVTLEQTSVNVISNVITINVEHKTYQGIKVTSESNSIPVGITKHFTATAYFGENNEDQYDVSLLSHWSSNSDAASVVLGFVHGNTVTVNTNAPVEITATFSSQSDFETVWITDAIVQSIDVTPDNIIISRGYSQQYTATGHFSDGSSHSLAAEEGVAWSVILNSDLNGDGLSDTNDRNSEVTIDGLVTNIHNDFSDTTSDNVTAKLSGISGSEKIYLPSKILLQHNGLEFSGTPSVGEVQAMGTPYDPEKAYYDAYLNFSEAQAYCDALVYNAFANWRLPTRDELQAFDDEYNPNGTTDLNSIYNWPLIAGYWTSTESDVDKHHNLGLLNVGGETSFPDDYAGNVSCVRVVN